MLRGQDFRDGCALSSKLDEQTSGGQGNAVLFENVGVKTAQGDCRS